jgi:hypothetical protein
MSAGATPPPLPRKRHNWLPAIIVSCAFAPLVILLIVFLNYRISNASAVRRLEAEIKKKGEPLTLADLAATYPPIPDEDNGAVLLVRLWQKEDPEFWTAFLEGVRPLPTRRDPRWDNALPFLGSESKDIFRSTKLNSESRTAAESFLKERAEHLNGLRHALSKTQFRFPIDVTYGVNTLLPHIAVIRQEAQNFRIEALLAAESGNMDAAIIASENVARAGSALASEPLVVSQLVRIAVYEMTLDLIERLLTAQAISKAQLGNLVVLVDRVEMRGGLRLSLVSERTMFRSLIEFPPKGAKYAPSNDMLGSRVGLGFYDFTGLKMADCRLMLETMEKAISLADYDDVSTLEEFEGFLSGVVAEAKRKPPKILCAMFLPALQKAVTKFASLEARRRAAIVALAVERFRLAKGGSTPESLNELIPQFLSSIPTDPFDGEPLRYKKLPVGFVVYSIGPDRTDDGGTERPQKGPQKNFDVTFVVER